MQTLEALPNLKTLAEQATVSALNYYPIKSCAGTSLSVAQTEPRGFIYDRELMLVAADTGNFLTQRELPRLALVRPAIEKERLRLEAPGMAGLDISLTRVGQPFATKIWRDTVQSVDQGDEVAAWFKAFLKSDCRLVRMAQSTVRKVNQNYANREDDQVSYADGYPFLLISEESLAELNRRLPDALPMNRFRPNIVLAGSGVPFLEDYLKRVQIGSIVFEIVKPCARCAITTTDQVTTQVGKEPLKTLATFRRGPLGSVLFGQNLLHSNQGILQLGDRLQVLELKKNVQIKPN